MVTTGLAHQLRRLLCQADPETVPDRMLAWLHPEVIPDGTSDEPALTQAQWEGVYLLLENSAIDGGVVRPLGLVKADTREIRPDDPLPIAIASFRIAVASSTFIADVQRAAANGNELQSPPAGLAGAIEPRRAFAATALMHDQWGRDTPQYLAATPSFVLDPRFLLANPGAPWPDAIEVDTGAGFATRRIGVPFEADGDLGDPPTVRVRCHYGGEALVAAFTFAVGEGPVPRPDETWPLQDPLATGPRPATGRAWVFRGDGNDDVVNPLILVEGFPGGHPYDYLYALLDNAGMIARLRADGYDLVIVGLDDGMQQIQSNVGVLVDCIRQARKRTPRPLVVGGMSMGGIISRLALAQLESIGEPHATRAYLSIDTPHRGSYTSMGVQWFVHALMAYLRGLGGYAALLDSPSNQQLMLEWLHDGGGGPSPKRAELLAALAAVGNYPHQPRKLAVACGRGDGVGSASAGAPTLDWSGSPFVAMTLRTLPGDAQRNIVAEGSWFLAEPQELPALAMPGANAWETAPGSLNDYNAQAAGIAKALRCGAVTTEHDRTCGIPTVSALDLDVSPFQAVGAASGPFDAYKFSSTAVMHLELTDELSNWIVDELGPPEDPDGASDPPWNPYAFNPHDLPFLNDPYPTYERFRCDAPVFYVSQYRSLWFFRHGDCKTILEGTDTFLKIPPSGPTPVPGPPGIMRVYPPGIFNSDPPRHTALRAQIGPPFKAALARARTLAEGYVHAQLDNVRPTGHMELITDFALPVPANVLFDILGIPTDPLLRRGLLDWETPIVLANDPTQTPRTRFAGATAAMALHHYVQGLVRQYRLGAGTGLIGVLAQAIGPTLTEEDVYSSCVDFVVAGYLSTTWLVASAITALIGQPSQLRRVAADRDLLAPVMTEALRMEPPFQLVDRYVAEETRLCGVTLAVGTKVTAVVGSANRDSAVFRDPDADTFDIDRQDTGQLAFGAGIHYCIGAPLAEIVAPVMLSGLLDLADLEVDGTPQWGSDPFLRGMANLPLRFRAQPVTP